jgi:predicted Zn-dependent protease
MFSPIVYNFGQVVAAGAMANIERQDEYQADKYGLMLMTRAGYDPAAMVSFMQHLGAYSDEHDSFIDAYLADHPETPKRVAALVGYPELDPRVRTEPQRLAAAIHDQEEGRYAIAARDFNAIVTADPGDTIARYHLGEAQIALGADADSERNLTLAAADGSTETKSLADAGIAALRAAVLPPSLQHADLPSLRDQLADAQRTQAQAATAIETRRDSGGDQLAALESREQAIADDMPDLSSVEARAGSPLDTMLTNVAAMSRALDTADGKSAQTLDGVGSAVNNRSGGLIKANADILAAMDAQLQADPASLHALASYPAYPRMLRGLARADADMVRAVDAARAALAVLDLALGDLQNFARTLRGIDVSRGDIDPRDDAALASATRGAVDSLNRAAVDASQAAQLYDMARAEQLQVRIDLLGLDSTPERYATLQHALDVRFHNATIDYQTMLQQDLTPGEVVAASVVGADTGTTPQTVVADARGSGRSIVEVANDRGMPALVLKVFVGLILFDYTDDPIAEARVRT